MSASLEDMARALRSSPSTARLAEAAIAAVRVQLAAEARIRGGAERARPLDTGALARTAPLPDYLPSLRRSWRCAIGIHRWRTFTLRLFKVIELGERMDRCERCGKRRAR
ncbi:hypothetical protein G3H63_09170 [Microbacterium resistens]|uniref:hypothetical protein n=1 Tax=Microbacterium resistens TaxID=156977 RepID=UPI001C59C154|nr:hypothetical protein [Microbacterium resistens]MBW1639240.1 hypothetical protein [Microbacterium resistens]